VIETANEADLAGLSLSRTVAVKLAVPLVVGVPEIAPVEDARVSPAGSLPELMDQLYGAAPPVACRVCE